MILFSLDYYHFALKFSAVFSWSSKSKARSYVSELGLLPWCNVEYGRFNLWDRNWPSAGAGYQSVSFSCLPGYGILSRLYIQKEVTDFLIFSYSQILHSHHLSSELIYFYFLLHRSLIHVLLSRLLHLGASTLQTQLHLWFCFMLFFQVVISWNTVQQYTLFQWTFL